MRESPVCMLNYKCENASEIAQNENPKDVLELDQFDRIRPLLILFWSHLADGTPSRFRLVFLFQALSKATLPKTKDPEIPPLFDN